MFSQGPTVLQILQRPASLPSGNVTLQFTSVQAVLFLIVLTADANR